LRINKRLNIKIKIQLRCNNILTKINLNHNIGNSEIKYFKFDHYIYFQMTSEIKNENYSFGDKS